MTYLCSGCIKKNNVLPGQTVHYYHPKRQRTDAAEVRKLRAKGIRVFDIAQRLGLTARRVYQILKAGRGANA